MVAQHVDDRNSVSCRHALEHLMVKHSRRQNCVVSGENSRDVFDGLSYVEADLLAPSEDGMSSELHDRHLHRLPGAIGWLLENHRHAVVGQRPPKCFGSLLSKGQD